MFAADVKGDISTYRSVLLFTCAFSLMLWFFIFSSAYFYPDIDIRLHVLGWTLLIMFCIGMKIEEFNQKLQEAKKFAEFGEE